MSGKSKLRYAVSCAVAVWAGQSALANPTNWVGGGTSDGLWATPSNWSTNASPTINDTVLFNDPVINPNADETITLPATAFATSIEFANTGTTTLTGTSNLSMRPGLTVDSGAGNVNFGSGISMNLNGNNQTYTNNSANGVTIAGTISTPGSASNVTLTLDGTATTGLITGKIIDGTGSVVNVQKNGPGTWELDSGSNSFTGNVTLNAGTLVIRSLNALGTNANPKTFTINGGTIAASTASRTLPAAISIVIAGDFTTGTSTSGGNPVHFTGPIDLGTLVHNVTFNNSSSWTGAITGTGGITKADSGSNITFLKLGSTGNTYSGPTTIISGTLSTVASNMTSPNSAVLLGPGTKLEMINGGFNTIGSLGDYLGGAGSTVTMGDLSADNVSIGNDNTNTTFSGAFLGADPSNNGGVIKIGTGTLTLAGNGSSFNGYHKISGGVLAISSISDGSLTPTIITSSGSNTATLSDATGVQVGMSINNGQTIPDGTTITAISGNTITLSANTTATSGTNATTIGFANSLGLATSAASNLILDGGTLSYLGAVKSTNRLFTLNATGGGLDASGTGPITFAGNTSAGANAIAISGTGTRTLTLSGTNTGANTLAPIIADDASSNATSLAKTGTGTWVVTGANTYTGATSVAGGKLTLATNLTTSSSVTVTGGTLELGAAGTRVIRTPTVSVSGGKLDLQDNKLLTQTAIGTATGGVYTAGSVSRLIQSGRNGGSWSGSGIVTSQSGAACAAALTTLAVATASDTGYGGTKTFAGQTVNPGDTLVMYTYAGDANLDGKINGDDYFKIDSGFAAHTSGYSAGDFNYDGRIDADDYFIIDKNYAEQTSVFPSAAPLNLEGVSAVPEPASLALLGLSTAGLFGRRRRHR